MIGRGCLILVWKPIIGCEKGREGAGSSGWLLCGLTFVAIRGLAFSIAGICSAI